MIHAKYDSLDEIIHVLYLYKYGSDEVIQLNNV